MLGHVPTTALGEATSWQPNRRDRRHEPEGTNHCRQHLRPHQSRRVGGTETESCPEALSHLTRWKSEGAVRTGGWAGTRSSKILACIKKSLQRCHLKKT